ncbi:ABC transporter A family member 12 [Diplonema papillatum]|nr:ABC transporter A family member 12 [Diplonema papillatum]
MQSMQSRVAGLLLKHLYAGRQFKTLLTFGPAVGLVLLAALLTNIVKTAADGPLVTVVDDKSTDVAIIALADEDAACAQFLRSRLTPGISSPQREGNLVVTVADPLLHARVFVARNGRISKGCEGRYALTLTYDRSKAVWVGPCLLVSNATHWQLDGQTWLQVPWKQYAPDADHALPWFSDAASASAAGVTGVLPSFSYHTGHSRSVTTYGFAREISSVVRNLQYRVGFPYYISSGENSANWSQDAAADRAVGGGVGPVASPTVSRVYERTHFFSRSPDPIRTMELDVPVVPTSALRMGALFSFLAAVWAVAVAVAKPMSIEMSSGVHRWTRQLGATDLEYSGSSVVFHFAVGCLILLPVGFAHEARAFVACLMALYCLLLVSSAAPLILRDTQGVVAALSGFRTGSFILTAVVAPSPFAFAACANPFTALYFALRVGDDLNCEKRQVTSAAAFSWLAVDCCVLTVAWLWLVCRRRCALRAETPTAVSSPLGPGRPGGGAASDDALSPVTGQTLAVRVSNLSKSFPAAAGRREHALRGVSFSVRYGEVFALLGAPGAGKSTLLGVLHRDVAPDAGGGGAADVAGRSVLLPAEPGALGVCQQENTLWGDLTAAQHAAVLARMNGAAPNLELLRRFEIPEDTPVALLSGGNQRRLCVALSFVSRPRVVVLDEPCSSVDPIGRTKIWECLAEKAREGVCIVVTSHHADEAGRIADRVGLLHGGRLVYDGPATSLLAKYGKGQTLLASLKHPHTDGPALLRNLPSEEAAALPKEWRGNDLCFTVDPGNPRLTTDLLRFLENHSSVQSVALCADQLQQVTRKLTSRSGSKCSEPAAGALDAAKGEAGAGAAPGGGADISSLFEDLDRSPLPAEPNLCFVSQTVAILRHRLLSCWVRLPVSWAQTLVLMSVIVTVLAVDLETMFKGSKLLILDNSNAMDNLPEAFRDLVESKPKQFWVARMPQEIYCLEISSGIHLNPSQLGVFVHASLGHAMDTVNFLFTTFLGMDVYSEMPSGSSPPDADDLGDSAKNMRVITVLASSVVMQMAFGIAQTERDINTKIRHVLELTGMKRGAYLAGSVAFDVLLCIPVALAVWLSAEGRRLDSFLPIHVLLVAATGSALHHIVINTLPRFSPHTAVLITLSICMSASLASEMLAASSVLGTVFRYSSPWGVFYSSGKLRAHGPGFYAKAYALHAVLLAVVWNLLNRKGGKSGCPVVRSEEAAGEHQCIDMDDELSSSQRSGDGSDGVAASRAVLQRCWKQYPGQPVAAVSDASLHLRRGECLGLLGPNGAGKSSVIRLMTGEETPTSGQVELLSTNVAACLQNCTLWGGMTGYEHFDTYLSIRYGAALTRQDRRKYIERAARVLAFTDKLHAPVATLSGGTKKKLQVLLALLTGADTILLDEPSAGLDSDTKSLLWAVLGHVLRKPQADKASEPVSIVFTTHVMAEAEAVCSRVCLFFSGSLRGVGDIAQLKKRHSACMAGSFTMCQADLAEDERLLRTPGHRVKSIIDGRHGIVLPPRCGQGGDNVLVQWLRVHRLHGSAHGVLLDVPQSPSAIRVCPAVRLDHAEHPQHEPASVVFNFKRSLEHHFPNAVQLERQNRSSPIKYLLPDAKSPSEYHATITAHASELGCNSFSLAPSAGLEQVFLELAEKFS